MLIIHRVGLTARLFFENLLDHDHYLEWLLSSLEAASISALPIWLLMLGIYWDNIMRYRKRGRRLAEVLLEKLREVCMARFEGLLRLTNNRLQSQSRQDPFSNSIFDYLALSRDSPASIPRQWYFQIHGTDIKSWCWHA